MSEQNDRTGRRPIALVMATAAVTLALGVTFAAVTGYLHPRGEVAQAMNEPSTSPAATAAPPAAQPKVVLVPVTQPVAEPEARGEGEHEEREERRGHHREREDDDD